MCGIAGIYNFNGTPVASSNLKKMTDLIAHRGPDGEGCYIDGPLGLGHRRLAVLDLSSLGKQPMANITGEIIITYNGEIYNFKELRRELESLGYKFRSHTDTEVILHAYEQWGELCLHHFNGIFAFAIWDRRQNALFLARDRHGVKPLYWYCNNSVFIFSSEIKAILSHPGVSPKICYPALNEYFTFQNIFTDLTLFDGIRLLPAGHTLTIKPSTSSQPKIERYWEYPSSGESLDITEDECAERLYKLFVQAVTRQLVSDVPVGAYLSGGMDSASITSIAVRHLPRLTTFTGGFDLTSASGMELGFDERAKAEILANLFKTEHYEVVMHAGDMEWVLPKLIWHLEDPRMGQCYPNYYVARLASRFVKVVLSGVGGDELFCGYPWRYYRGLSNIGRNGYFQKYYQFWQRLVPEEEKSQLFNTNTRRNIGHYSTFDVFKNIFTEWKGEYCNNEDYVRASLYFELKTFLHGLLVVEDKLSMAHGIETRAPFLDNDLVDFAMQIPVRYKLHNIDQIIPMDENNPGKRLLYNKVTNDGKAVLRKTMSRLIPHKITKSRKQGFSAPDASWFRGESINYIDQFLKNNNALIYEFLTPQYVLRILDEHCSGKVNRRLLIWSFLCFEWWLRTFFGT